MAHDMHVASGDLELINAINHAANTGATLEQIVEILADGARRLFSSYGATVYLLSQDGSSLHMQNLRLSPWIRNKIERLIGHRIGSVDIPLTEGSAYRRLLYGRPHVLDDPDEIKRMAEECAPTDALKALVPRILKLEHIASLMEVPLVAEGTPVGLLEVSGKRRFTQAEVDRLAVLGEQLALVLTRKRLEEATRNEWVRLRDFFEHLPLLAFFLGRDGRILDCNQKAVAALGCASSQDLLGRDWVHALHPPGEQQKATEQLERWKELGHVEAERSRLVTRAGELVDVVTMFNTVRDVGGGPARGIVTHLDVTAWERARRDLSLSEARYQSLVETSGVGVAAADVQGNFTFVNRAFCRMTGYRIEELLGQPFPAFLYSRDRNRVLGVFRRALAGRVIRADLEFRMVHRDGHWVHMYSSPTAVRDNGRIVGFNAIITDITELKEKEEELQEHLEESRTISETAIALSRAGSADDVCRILGECVHEFNPDAVVVVTLADKDSRLIRPRVLLGADDTGDMMSRVLGQDPMAMEFPPEEIREEGWRLFTTGRLERVPEGIYDLLAGRVSTAACYALEEALGVNAVYGAGFGLEGVPSGGVLVLTRHDAGVKHGFAVEMLVSHAAVVIRQREAEASLRRSEERFAAFMDHLPAGAYIKDADSRALYVNGYMREVMGADETWIGRSVADILPERVARKMIADDRMALEQGSLVTEETVPDKNGVDRVYETHKFSIAGMADEQLLGGLSIDITQRKQAEEALLKSEREFRALFERMKDAVFLVLPEGTILRANEAGSQLVGYDSEHIRGMHVSELYADPGDRTHLLEKLERDGYLTDYNLRVKRHDGRVMDCLVQISQLFDADGNSTGRIVVLRDVTQERHMQEELHDSHRRLRELASHLEEAREQERASIARELHDDLGQLLTALKMDLSSLQREFLGRGIDIAPKTNAMSELVSQALAVSKRLSAELRPGVLDDLGLAAALEWQGQQFEERTGVRCRAMVQDLSLEPGCATALFRICQEALTNVARHAHASLVEVRLTAGGRGVVLRVTDDGRGIDERQLSDPQAFGLMGMHERVRSYGGHVSIVGKPGKGTTVTALLPRSTCQG